MIQFVKKRDGRKDNFNPDKITNAILKAMACSEDKLGKDEGLARQLTVKVTDQLTKESSEGEGETVDVEHVHDLVEMALMRSPRPAAAQEYIRYRNKRNLARKASTKEIFDSIVMAQKNEITRENANMNADTPAGMMMKFASEASKTYVDEALLAEDVQAVVKENLLHIHDKDYYPTKSLTCIQHPTDKLLKNGFVDGHASVRPAKRIETAATVACITMEAVQNDIASEPVKEYIAKQLPEPTPGDVDVIMAMSMIKQLAINRTVRRVHQAMESFVHNMNTIHSRGGNQVVFSSINYGTDTSPEGRCVIREILNTTYQGVGNGETAIFPIQIWKKKRGVSYLPGDPNYDLYRFACKVTARRFFPNFLNLDAPYNQDPEWKADDPERYVHEVATMGCRTRVYENRFGPKTSIGRGNLSFSTVNLPGMAIRCMEYKDKTTRIEAFFNLLGQVLDITAKQLDDRFKFQATAMAKQFPMLMSGMWMGSEKLGPNDTIASVINQGTLGIGFIGLAECLIALVGHHHAESDEAQELGIQIVSFMREKVNRYCEKYQHNYSVLATPAEGLAGRFTRIDKKRFGIIPGVTDKDYYTNSNHVPVYYHCTPEHKARTEAPYHPLTGGGHIFYVEIDGDATHNPEAIMQVVDLMDRYELGYGSVNHNRIRCLDCGYETSEGGLKTCPKCGGERLDILQRITGYLVGTTDRWNSGKKAELKDRVVHK